MSVVPGPASGATATSVPAWEQWLRLPGVFDLAGPRTDGLMVAAAHTHLVLVARSGRTSDYAPTYSAPDGPESYVALSPGLAVDGAACGFARDAVPALALSATPPGV